MTTKAVPTVQIENDRVRVTEWRFAKGAATGFHRHEYDYVVVPGTTGKLKIVGPDGSENFAELTAGQSYAREAGVEHDVINAHDGELVFVEIELKPSPSSDSDSTNLIHLLKNTTISLT